MKARSLILAAALLAAAPTLAAHIPKREFPFRGITLQQLIASCSVDARHNPLTLTCPAGCTVRIFNGPSADAAPVPVIAPACRALR